MSDEDVVLIYLRAVRYIFICSLGKLSKFSCWLGDSDLVASQEIHKLLSSLFRDSDLVAG